MNLNSIKITLRYLWRNRLFTALNILGLSIGICACWTIFRIVDYEFSFDKKHSKGETIYQVTNKAIFEGEESGFGGVPLAIYPALNQSIVGLDLAVPIYTRYIVKIDVPQENGEPDLIFEEPQNFTATTADYFKMVPHIWLFGNPETALNAPNKIILTESRARSYFPGQSLESLAHKSLTYYSMSDTVTRVISGIVKDLDYSSSFGSKEFVALGKDDLTATNWSSMNSDNVLFVKIKDNQSIQYVLDFINKKNKELTREFQEKYNFKNWYEVLPLSEKHFEPQYAGRDRTVDRKVLYGLMGIAAFLLVLAGINYINLSTSQLPQRSKEIGVRKTLGGNPRSLISHFMLETFVIVLFAFLLSMPLSILFTTTFTEFIPGGFNDFSNYPNLILFVVGLLFLITFISSVYPAWLITRVQTVEVLKGQTDKKLKGTKLTLRKSLIVFQFIIAQVFIVSALIMGQQLQYTMNKDMGFNHEAIITANIPYKYADKEKDPFVFKHALEKYPEIAMVSLGHRPLNNSRWGNILFRQVDTATTQVSVSFKYGDEDYTDLYRFEFLAGRSGVVKDSVEEYVVNETLIKAFGYKSPQDAVGQVLADGDQNLHTIVGVVADFHQLDFSSKIEPVVIVTAKNQLNAVNIKLAASSPGQWNETIKLIEKEWKGIYTETPFDFKFYDETIENLYESERNMSKLITLATTVCIIISCLGLFGLATLTAFQRTKEIGVRKVLGASISSIIKLLSTDFVKLVLVAILIASPIAWWAMNKWLEDFAYRVDIQWWMFALAGVLAVAIALLTVSSQAIKAAITNPVDSLRDE